MALTRPHGDVTPDDAGITREEYERVTKEIRFRMYAELLPGTEHGVVVLGHHADDADENALEQLCRGHRVGESRRTACKMHSQ